MSKVNVVFFASLKESLGKSSYEAELELPMSIAQLKLHLAERLDDGKALLDKGVQSSVDFEFARDDGMVLESVREVAFFPPVTGG